jgi:hypothetical protein
MEGAPVNSELRLQIEVTGHVLQLLEAHNELTWVRVPLVRPLLEQDGDRAPRCLDRRKKDVLWREN